MMRMQKKKKRRREQALESKDREMGWSSSFGYEKSKIFYNAEEDRYCPLAQARKRNALTLKSKTSSGISSSSKTSKTFNFEDNFSTPEIMASATIALSGMGSDQPIPKKIPLPPVTQLNNFTSTGEAAADNKTTTITFQQNYETGDSLELVKLILSREKLLSIFKRIISDSEGERAVLTSLGKGEKFKFPADKFKAAAKELRDATIKIVEMIIIWKSKQPDTSMSYLFRDEDYLLKISGDYKFLMKDGNEDARAALDSIDLYCNPFLSPIPLRHDMIIQNPDASIDITAEINDNSTIDGADNTNDHINSSLFTHERHWATKDEFHDTTNRLVDGVDILQIRDVSLFVIDEIRENVDLAYEEEDGNQGGIVRRGDSDAGADADGNGEGKVNADYDASPEMDDENSFSSTDDFVNTNKSSTSKQTIPFFEYAKLKYAKLLPQRTMLGDPVGLSDFELEETIEKTGKGEKFDSKTNHWKQADNIDMASQRRGTFFGTINTRVAQTPEMKLRRIVETVAMLRAKERLHIVKLELESLVKKGSEQERDIELLREELEKLREKANASKSLHDKAVELRAFEKARKLKVKWSYWFEEQKALACQIKSMSAKIFFYKEDLARYVRTIERLEDEYAVERNKAIILQKKRAAANLRREIAASNAIQVVARGYVTRKKICPFLLERKLAAIKISNLQRQKVAKNRVESIRSYQTSRNKAATALQSKSRQIKAKHEVKIVRLEKKQQAEAATKLQCKCRTKIANKRTNDKRKEKEENEAAVKLQTRTRIKKSKQIVAGKREVRQQNNAAMILQKKGRGRLAKKETERRRKRKIESTCAVKIQTRIRMYNASRRVERIRAARVARLKREAEEEAERKRIEAEKEALRIKQLEEEAFKEKIRLLKEEKAAKKMKEQEDKEREERERAEKEEEARLAAAVELETENEGLSLGLDVNDTDAGILDDDDDEFDLSADLSIVQLENSMNESLGIFDADDDVDDDASISTSVSLQKETRPITAGERHYKELGEHILQKNLILAHQESVKSDIEEHSRHLSFKAVGQSVVFSLQAAHPNNVQSIVDDMKKPGRRKIEAQKYLAHAGYNARVRQSLILTAQKGIKDMQIAKLRKLQDRKAAAFKGLKHAHVRYVASLWLEERAEEEYEKAQRDHEKVRGEAFEFLCNTANRWMN